MTAKEATWVTNIVRDAGGVVTGRTRLQKIGFLLEATGLGEGFKFRYMQYGPYSDDLAAGARTAVLLESLNEVERPASWGGLYSEYSTNLPQREGVPAARLEIAQEGARANAIQLELLATAIFLANEGEKDPWAETQRRKPEKAKLRLEGAQELYKRLIQIQTPQALPNL
jgi:uncharacterized protein